MSVDAFIEFEVAGDVEVLSEPLPKEMEAEGATYGRNVARNLRWVDGLCREIGGESLSRFVVYAEDVDDLKDLSSTTGRWEHRGPWFDPEPALEVVRTIQNHLSRFERGTRIHSHGNVIDPEHILWDLRAYRAILERAVESRRRFRIALG